MKWHDAGAVWCLGWSALLILSGLLTVSCSAHRRPQLYPVQGKVLYKGQPAAGAKVVFHPKGTADPQPLCPLATVQPDGSFMLATFQPGDGAPAGEYAVVVTWPSKGGGKVAGGAVDRLRGAYGDPDRSPLQARVVEGNNELADFDLR